MRRSLAHARLRRPRGRKRRLRVSSSGLHAGSQPADALCIRGQMPVDADGFDAAQVCGCGGQAPRKSRRGLRRRLERIIQLRQKRKHLVC